MHNPALLRDEDFRADQLAPEVCYEPVECEACGATVPECEAELIDAMYFCASCAGEYRRIGSMCR